MGASAKTTLKTEQKLDDYLRCDSWCLHKYFAAITVPILYFSFTVC